MMVKHEMKSIKTRYTPIYCKCKLERECIEICNMIEKGGKRDEATFALVGENTRVELSLFLHWIRSKNQNKADRLAQDLNNIEKGQIRLLHMDLSPSASLSSKMQWAVCRDWATAWSGEDLQKTRRLRSPQESELICADTKSFRFRAPLRVRNSVNEADDS